MSASQEYSAEQVQAIKRQQKREDPRFWMRYELSHPNRAGEPYDFRNDDGEKLNYLLDDDGPLVPENWGNIVVLLMARSCLKTTSTTALVGWLLDQYPNSSAFMSAPRQDQVKAFVEGFRSNLRDTNLANRRVKNTYTRQGFETTVKDGDGDTLTLDSALETRSAWGEGDQLRGPHSQMGVLDEAQDVEAETFSVFLEIIDQSVPDKKGVFPVTFFIGTPKLTNSFFHNVWSLSDQKTWDYDQQKWIQQDEVGSYAPDVVCEICGVKVDPDADECPECSNAIDSDVDPFEVTGWHIDQPNCPLHSESEVKFKESNYSDQRFENEVLANFYSPEDNLLSESHIQAVFDSDEGWKYQRTSDDVRTIITVDWGGGSNQNASDTTMTVGEYANTPDGDNDYNITVLNNRFVDHDVTQSDEEEMVRKWIDRYSPDSVLVDEGYNGSRRLSLQDDYPRTVHGINYGSTTPAEDLNWREDERGREVLFTADKTYCAESMVNAMKAGKFTIPTEDLTFGGSSSDGTKLINQLTATVKDYKTTPSGTKKLRVISERNDDAFDTFTYLWVAAVMMQNEATLTDVALTNRRGY